jgi:replicative DNA helicase
MTGELRIANFDLALERAMASEAVFGFAKYAALGLDLGDFESQQCRWVVQAAEQAWELDGEQGLDATVRGLQRMERLQAVGGRQGLMDMLAEAGAPDAARFRALARTRRLRAACLEAARSAEAGDAAAASQRLQEALADGEASCQVKVRTAAELGEIVFAGIADEAHGRVRRFFPGLERLRQAIGDLPAGSCTVVAADTNVGKSSFVLAMATGCAGLELDPVTFGLVSVEDPDEVTGTRLLGVYSGMSSRRIQRRAFHDRAEALARLSQGIGRMRSLGSRLLFADCSGGTEVDVCAARSQMAARGARIIAVDYLTEIESSVKQQDRRNEVRWVAKRLKVHAKRLGVALVLVSQIARPADKNPNSKPSKHSLKESGDVSNAAEVILLLWRESESDDAPIFVNVAKCKWGGVGDTWSMVRDRETGLLREEP